MSSSANPQHEPTMEEILASIRKIISEDQPQAAAPAPAPAPATPRPAPIVESVPVPQPAADVLELTEEVRDEEPEPAPAPQPAPVMENDIAFETIESEPKADPNMDHDDLISDATRSAMGRAFANLDSEPAPYSAPAGNTLEALFLRAVTDAFVPTLKDWVDDHHAEVMSNLKPLIRAWMDEHLPHLIETAVTKEIARAAAERPRRR
jgi:cell pole-organizing protein PopZ